MTHEDQVPQAEHTAASGEATNAQAAAAAPSGEPMVHEPEETRSQVEVGLVRSVRFGPILIVTGILGAVIAAVAALFFPVASDAMYELGQVVGFSALIGAAIGLFVGGVLALILAGVAKRQSGAAIAVLTDVR